MVDLARLFESIGRSLEHIADEFGEWEVTLEALWESSNKYYAVLHATLEGKSKYFGYEFWNWQTRVAPTENVEADLAGVLTWHFMAGDYAAQLSTSDGSFIDWRSGSSSELPRTLSELDALRVIRKR